MKRAILRFKSFVKKNWIPIAIALVGLVVAVVALVLLQKQQPNQELAQELARKLFQAPVNPAIPGIQGPAIPAILGIQGPAIPTIPAIPVIPAAPAIQAPVATTAPVALATPRHTPRPTVPTQAPARNRITQTRQEQDREIAMDLFNKRQGADRITGISGRYDDSTGGHDQQYSGDGQDGGNRQGRGNRHRQGRGNRQGRANRDDSGDSGYRQDEDPSGLGL